MIFEDSRAYCSMNMMDELWRARALKLQKRIDELEQEVKDTLILNERQRKMILQLQEEVNLAKPKSSILRRF